MAKSNYLFKLLSLAVIFICGYAGGTGVVVSCRLPVVRKVQVHSDFWDNNQQLKKYQVSSIGYQVARQRTTNSQQLNVKRIYDAELGVKETGNNGGKRVEEYLRYVNLKKGEPWCAAFVCWVYGQAGVANPKSAWSPDLFRADKVIWKRNSNKYQVSSIRNRESDARHRAGLFSEFRLTYYVQHKTYNSPQPADIFALWFPEKNRIAHTGFIDQWDDKWLITVEGNTNMDGSREGDGVYRKRRLQSSIYAVASYL